MNRLEEANYSDDRFYHYTYDAVGNWLSASDQFSVNSYQYDDANRMTGVNGISHTWDANGNLLDDGVNTYEYDPANRLTSVIGPPSPTPIMVLATVYGLPSTVYPPPPSLWTTTPA